MGLDQYGMIDGETTHQWRKHNRLQGFMQEIFAEQYSQDCDFNCKVINLSLDDIDRLENHNNNKSLPATSGFFFGYDSYDKNQSIWFKEQNDILVDFIAKAREALKNDISVQYDCWW